MAIKIKFDLNGNPEPPTIILATRSGKKLGQLDVDVESIDLSGKLNDASEFSFTLNKYVDGEITNLWDKVVDFKLAYCKEWDMWFEISVELDEETETIKTVFCTQLGQAELSQIMLYDIHINEEGDSNWSKDKEVYKSTILFNEKDTEASLLHRLLKDKAPHYSIAHVDSTIANEQRTFSFDGESIANAFSDIGEEIGCLFIYNSNSDENGNIQRTISVYDLQQKCLNPECGYRGEFTDKCPKCDGTDIKYGYGKDTLIFVTSDELAASGIELTTDTDSVKNCFKLEAGDDLMTATVRNCNPNGTDYIQRFSKDMKADMSDELVEAIENYDKEYKEYYNDKEFNIDSEFLNGYNGLVTKYSAYKNDLLPISNTIKGYSSLMNAYYNAVDLALYLESALMPSIEIAETDAAKQAALLTTSSLSPVAVANIKTVSLATANSAVLAMAKIIVRSTYKVEVNTSTLTTNGDGEETWTGNFVVTNYSDEEDTAVSATISVVVNGDEESFVKQKIDKALNKEDTDDYSISGLFAKDYDDFCAELKKYALKPLISFRDACQACIDILIEQGVTDEDGSKADLYKNLYMPYYNKLMAIESEVKIREDEVNLIKGVYTKDADGNEILVTDGLSTYIIKIKNEVQDALNFEKYLGEDLWLEFCTYRREDKYSNDNYISDGLDNAKLFKRAKEFIEVAENEIFKASELQHSISTSLKNLLAIKKFKPLVDSFEVGNWIRVQVDEKIYKLRLLEYEIDYGSFDDISVEFSDATKVKNGVTDVESVLSQASSMATSYSSVQRQASQGEDVKGTVDEWLANGLNSALVKIQNNDSEEITITKNGLLGRSYNEITDTYSPEQFKLTHNIFAYTTDNWRTISSALGKHSYKYWNGTEFVDDEDYGLTTKFVTAGYVTGSQIIGGEIVSSNYKKGESGTYINLIDGDFDLAGSKIVYDVKSNVLNLKDVTIAWDTTNDIPTSSVDGLDETIDDLEAATKDAEQNAKEYADEKDSALSTDLTTAYETYTNSKVSELDTAVGNYLGLKDSTLIGSSYVISPYIGGGYLNITSTDNKSRVLIDPNNLTGNDFIFQVHHNDTVSVGIAKDGSASFSGDITATSLTLSGCTVSTNDISGLSSVATSGNYNDLSNRPTIPTSAADLGIDTSKIIYKGDIKQETKTDSNGINYLETSVPTTDGNITYSTYDANDYIVFGRSKGTNSSGNNYVCVSKDGLLTARNALIYGTIYATDGEFTGEVTATSGKIGGWTISGYSLLREYESGDTTRSIFMQGYGTDTNNAFAVRHKTSSDTSWAYDFYVRNDGYLYANNANIEGKITASSGSITGNLNITGSIINTKGNYTVTLRGVQDTLTNGVFYITDKSSGSATYPFRINGDGSVNATKLSGVSGTFTRLSAGGTVLTSTQIKISTPSAKDAEGAVYIGASGVDGWEDITIRPSSDNLGNIGTSGKSWDMIYVKNGAVHSSDRNCKTDISKMGEKQERLFNLLSPVTFKFIDSSYDRYHYGFISQEVEDAIYECGLTTKDFAGFCKDVKRDDNGKLVFDEDGNQEYVYSLRYTEFIALNTHMIQKLNERIIELENRLKQLEN